MGSDPSYETPVKTRTDRNNSLLRRYHGTREDATLGSPDATTTRTMELNDQDNQDIAEPLRDDLYFSVPHLEFPNSEQDVVEAQDQELFDAPMDEETFELNDLTPRRRKNAGGEQLFIQSGHNLVCVLNRVRGHF